MRLVLLVVLIGSLALTAPLSAGAFDATGHWVGKWTCKGFSAPFTNDTGKQVNKFSGGNGASTLDITQGQTFAAIIDAGQQDGEFTYNAVAVPAVKDPANNGNIILLGCHLGSTLPASGDAELVQMTIKTKANDVKATIKGMSIFADDFPESGICKYSYKRISLTDGAGAIPCP